MVPEPGGSTLCYTYCVWNSIVLLHPMSFPHAPISCLDSSSIHTRGGVCEPTPSAAWAGSYHVMHARLPSCMLAWRQVGGARWRQAGLHE